MTSLTTHDFRSISHKEGNVFFNQNTGCLDTREGNFLSRLVTWIKAKYNPGRVNQEYKAAVDSFTAEIKRAHNQIFQKYDPHYSINNENLSKLYHLDKPDKPLAMRQVRQALVRLESIPSSLEIVNRHSNEQYCRKALMTEMSKNPEYHQPYEPSHNEIEKLSSQIKVAIMDEMYQQEGLLTDDLAASIARKATKQYSQSRALKIATAQCGWEDCMEALNKELSKHPDLYKRCELCSADIDGLSFRIKDAIMEESYWQGKSISEDDAVMIRDKIIKQNAAKTIEALSSQKAIYEQVATQAKPAAALKSTQKTAQHHQPPALERVEDLPSGMGNHAPLETQIPQQTTVKSGEWAKQLDLSELPHSLKQQLSSRQIDSKEKLIQASNVYMAKRISGQPLRSFYFDSYKKIVGTKPKQIPSDLIDKVEVHIQSMPTLMTRQQGDAYMKQTVIDYINDAQRRI